MWTDVSSSVPHFLQVGLLFSSIIYRCLLKVLCPASRPITSLGCVLLRDNNRALVARSGPEINSRASLCVLQGPHHSTTCWFSIRHFIFLLIFSLETPSKGFGPTYRWTEPSLANLSAISFLRISTCPGTQNQSHTPINTSLSTFIIAELKVYMWLYIYFPCFINIFIFYLFILFYFYFILFYFILFYFISFYFITLINFEESKFIWRGYFILDFHVPR